MTPTDSDSTPRRCAHCCTPASVDDAARQRHLAGQKLRQLRRHRAAKTSRLEQASPDRRQQSLIRKLQRREDHHRQRKVRQRTRGGHQDALPDQAAREATVGRDGGLEGRQRVQAGQGHVAAKRQRRGPVVRPAPADPRQAAAKTHRDDRHRHEAGRFAAAKWPASWMSTMTAISTAAERMLSMEPPGHLHTRGIVIWRRLRGGGRTARPPALAARGQEGVGQFGLDGEGKSPAGACGMMLPQICAPGGPSGKVVFLLFSDECW